ncbi:MAG: hypothetical protein IT182_19530 [Acidobacteria bacterium]|nr:hypothetical protein [Acidobacteriota bacterium]
MTTATMAATRPQAGFLDRLNTDWHELGLRVFTGIVLLHWFEHLLQAFQIYVLGWPVPQAGGFAGYFFPWVIKSELLHYGYAVVMLVGLWILRRGFTAPADRFWWMVAFWIQFFHHIEHALLQGQAILGMNLLGRPVPVSLVQLWVPRVELHLFYNTIVFIPMMIAMYYHLFPSPSEHATFQCSCARYAPTHDRSLARA